jgi:phosphonopyruvate decarboxylase/aminotransferase
MMPQNTEALAMPTINPELAACEALSSKEISRQARELPDTLDLSIGEPAFDLPRSLLDDIARQDLQGAPFLATATRYEDLRGARVLRQAVADWYAQRYAMTLDPEREILITHGAVEALNLALLCVTAPGERVACADPGYPVYARALRLCGRQAVALRRPLAEHEFAAALMEAPLPDCKALLLNSPENPSAYVASSADWQAIASAVEDADCWLIHDEVYDTMAFSRTHRPARQFPALSARSLLVNSCSKKFGMPGLRIGWLIADGAVIDAACKAHECLCLSVGPLAERIAAHLLNDSGAYSWLEVQRQRLQRRNQQAMARLGKEQGFRWLREPMGGMFLFPDVGELYAQLPPAYHDSARTPGAAVADYLLRERRVATVPGALYGAASTQHIRLSNCGTDATFEAALERLSPLLAGAQP